MKKIIILAIVFLFTACSGETEESALNSVTTNSSAEVMQTSSTKTTAENSSAEPSISEATTKIDIQDWEFNLDGLSDRLTDIALIDQSRGFIPPAQYSLFDLDFDGVPEFVASHHAPPNPSSMHDIYNILHYMEVGSTGTTEIASKEFSEIFNGVYYIDSETNQRYYIQSYLMMWGSDGCSNVYVKAIIQDGFLIKDDIITFPLEQDGEPLYDYEEPINLFASEDECRELYIKSVLVEYIYDETESELRGRIKTAMERLVDDYYSDL